MCIRLHDAVLFCGTHVTHQARVVLMRHNVECHRVPLAAVPTHTPQPYSSAGKPEDEGLLGASACMLWRLFYSRGSGGCGRGCAGLRRLSFLPAECYATVRCGPPGIGRVFPVAPRGQIIGAALEAACSGVRL